MASTSTTQAGKAAELLEKAMSSGDWAATFLQDVVSLCKEPDGELVPLEQALALLGRAQMARHSAQWAIDSANEVIVALVQQAHLSSDSEPFARYDLNEVALEFADAS